MRKNCVSSRRVAPRLPRWQRQILTAAIAPVALVGVVSLADIIVPGNFNLNSDSGSPVYQEGLIEGFTNLSFDTTTVNPNNSSPELGLRMATTTAFGTDLWANPRTWIYTGQIFTGPNGTISVAANNDDADWFKINGNVVLTDAAYNTALASVVTGLTPNTWVDFEYRVADTGAGGAGPSAQNINGATGWTNTIGAVLSFQNLAGSLNAAAYTYGLAGVGSYEVANGTPELFRYQTGFGFTDTIHVQASGTGTLDGNNASIIEPRLIFETTGATLTLNDGTGVHKTIGFTNGTTLATANGQSNTIAGSADVRLGVMSDGGFTGVTLTYAGTGKLILDSTSGNTAPGAIIAAGAGGRVFVSGNGAANLGGLAISGAGGVLNIGGVASATYDNALFVTASGTLQHTATGTDTVGGANGVFISGGTTLTVENTGGALTVAGTVTGGSINKIGASAVRFGGNVALDAFTNNAGTSTLAAGTTLIGSLVNNGGTTAITGTATVTNTAVNAGRVAFSGPTTLTNAPTIAAGATLALLNSSGGNSIPAPNISTGTLEVLPGALGAASNPVTLSGGALSIVGNSAGLSTFIFGGDDAGATANFNGFANYTNYFSGRGTTVGQNGLEILTSSAANGVTELNYVPAPANGPVFAVYGSQRLDNVVARFLGNIVVTDDGSYTFGTTSDDGSVLYIDGQQVVNNNFNQGATRREGSLTLSAGTHQIDIGYFEGAVDNSLVVDWTGPNFGRQNLQNAVLSSGGALNFDNPISLTESSTISVIGNNLSRSIASSITLAAGKTLSTTGGELTATTLALTTGIIDAQNVFIANAINSGGAPVNITKTGAGIFALDPTGPILQAGGTISVQAGQLGLVLGGPNAPLGNASVTFAGGGLALSSRAGDQTYALPTLTGSPVITALKIGTNSDSGAPGVPVNITLSGSLNVPAAQSITLGSVGNYRLHVNGAATGGGSAIIDRGTVVADTGTALQGLAVTTGSAAGPGNLIVTADTISIASLANASTGASTVTVGTGAGPATLTIGNSGTALTRYRGSVFAAPGTSLQIVKSGASVQSLGGATNADAFTVTGGVLELTTTAAGISPITLNGGTVRFADPGLTLKIYDSDPTPSGAYGGILNTLPGAKIHFAGLTPAIVTNTAADNNQVIRYLDPTPPNPAAPLDGAPFRIHGSTDVDTIEAFFNGKFYAPTAGSYTFHPRSDDGTLVYVDGATLVNNNFGQGVDENTQAARDRSITLTAGYHDIAIAFNEGNGGATMSVEVTAPGGTRRLLNNNELFRTDLTVISAINVGAAGGTIDPLSSSLNLAGPVSGTGPLSIEAGTVTSIGAMSAGSIVLKAGATLSPGGNLTTNTGTTVRDGATLQVRGNAVTGGLLLDGGTLRASSGVNDFGTSAIVGTPITSTATPDALRASVYLATGLGIDTAASVNIARTLPPTSTLPLTGPLDFTPQGQGDAPFAAFFNQPTIASNDAPFTASFTGRYTAASTGSKYFGLTQNDDRAVFWVDLNQNGVYETDGSAGNELLVNNGCCGFDTGAFVNLVSGQTYNVFIAVEDTGGGSSLQGVFDNGGGRNIINPGSQPGLWSFGQPTGGALLQVDAGATIKAGSLLNGRTVSFTGAGGILQLDSGATATASTTDVITNLNGTASTLTLGANNTLTAAHLDIATSSTLIKNGAGILDATAQSLGNASILRIDAGTVLLRGTDAIGLPGSGGGSVVVNSTGTLDIRGSINGTVNLAGGTLRGTGTIGDLLAPTGGTIAPGNAVGKLTVNTLVASPATTVQLQISSGATPGSSIGGLDYDQIVIASNNIDLGNAALTLSVFGTLQVNDILTLVLNNGADPDPGLFAGYANGALINLPGGYQVQLSYRDDASTPAFELSGGNDVSVLVTVPEPGTLATIASGLGMLLGLQRFRRRG